VNRIYNLRPSLPDHRDFIGYPSPVAPPAFAQLPIQPPIRDQGQEGACTGFSSTGGYEALVMPHGDNSLYSPAFTYYQARLNERSPGEDAGASLSDVMDVALKLGFALESEMPYVVGGYASMPSARAESDALAHRITSYARCPTLADMKAAILAGQPVILGIVVYESFETIGADGIVPIPGPTEQALGGHAILLWAYGECAGAPGPDYATANNSWSTRFGDNGKVYFPYAYLSNRNFTFEAWTFSV